MRERGRGTGVRLASGDGLMTARHWQMANWESESERERQRQRQSIAEWEIKECQRWVCSCDNCVEVYCNMALWCDELEELMEFLG